MCSCRYVCWCFSRIYVFAIGLNVLAATHPIFFYPRRELNRRHRVRFPASKWRHDQPVRLTYKLDAWSQYDNPEEGKALEGDILVRPGSRKTLTTDKDLLWPYGVVRYFIDDSLTNEPTKLSILENAMKDIGDATCLKFVRIYPESDGKFPSTAWVNITGKDKGCYSDLGRSDVSSSTINLNIDKCFRTKGHAIHEILHTLGAFHEHMRPDRDQYIKILWNNIKDGDEYNFRIVEKDAATAHGLPYDYDSIMHYSMTAFSKDRSMPTIIPRQPGVHIGQRDHLSFYDIQKLLRTYNCNEVDPKYAYRTVDDEQGNVKSLHTNASKTVRRNSVDRLIMPEHRFDDYYKFYTWRPRTVLLYPKSAAYPYSTGDYFN